MTCVVMAALTLGHVLREKGWSMLFLVQESEHLCWKSHINENTILAVAEIHSAEFLGFLTLSCCLFFPLANFLLWKSRKISSNGADYTQFPTWHFPASFSTPVLPPDFHHWVISLYQHQTCDLVLTFKGFNSLFPTSLSSSHSTFLCLLKDLG